jgi:hypothetical protein
LRKRIGCVRVFGRRGGNRTTPGITGIKGQKQRGVSRGARLAACAIAGEACGNFVTPSLRVRLGLRKRPRCRVELRFKSWGGVAEEWVG